MSQTCAIYEINNFPRFITIVIAHAHCSSLHPYRVYRVSLSVFMQKKQYATHCNELPSEKIQLPAALYLFDP